MRALLPFLATVLRVGVALGATSLHGCARSSFDPTGDGTDLPRDGTDAPPTDDGGLAGPADAGDPVLDAGPCADRDGDGVCDADDNCPGRVNPGQEDADGNGRGDVCETTCAPETLPSELQLEDLTVRNVSLDGMGNALTVAAEARLELALSYEFTACESDEGARQVLVGFDDGALPACIVEAGCPGAVLGTARPHLTAPREPGNYALYLTIARRAQCEAVWPDGLPEATQRIATLCVQ